jgi:hypothetical protein
MKKRRKHFLDTLDEQESRPSQVKSLMVCSMALCAAEDTDFTMQYLFSPQPGLQEPSVQLHLLTLLLRPMETLA